MAKNKGISARNLGIILLIAAILQLLPINIPFMNEDMIGTLIVLIVAIYLLLR